METMEVDNSEASTSASTAAVTDPMEGSSGTNDTLTISSVTAQTPTVKSDLNTPWFVYFPP